MMTMVTDPEVESILTEVRRASEEEVRFYLLGAAHDGTFNRSHKTLRISQADVRWLEVLKEVLLKLGRRSWIYREGTRSVWTIETTHRSETTEPDSDAGRIAFRARLLRFPRRHPTHPDDSLR